MGSRSRLWYRVHLAHLYLWRPEGGLETVLVLIRVSRRGVSRASVVDRRRTRVEEVHCPCPSSFLFQNRMLSPGSTMTSAQARMHGHMGERSVFDDQVQFQIASRGSSCAFLALLLVSIHTPVNEHMHTRTTLLAVSIVCRASCVRYWRRRQVPRWRSRRWVAHLATCLRDVSTS